MALRTIGVADNRKNPLAGSALARVDATGFATPLPTDKHRPERFGKGIALYAPEEDVLVYREDGVAIVVGVGRAISGVIRRTTDSVVVAVVTGGRVPRVAQRDGRVIPIVAYPGCVFSINAGSCLVTELTRNESAPESSATPAPETVAPSSESDG